MIDPDPESRITIQEVQEHEWFTAPLMKNNDLLASMKLKHKVVEQHLNSLDFDVNDKNLFHNFKIPNDWEVKTIPRRSLRKGFQLKKYSECFKYITGDSLFTAIISFAESHGLAHVEDSKMSTVVIESHEEDINLSIKANVVNNPSCEMQCIEWVKLRGDKTPFMKVFSQLCEHCMSLETKHKE